MSNVRDHPLLSILIANLAESDEPSSLLKTGNLVLLVTSAITALRYHCLLRSNRVLGAGAIAGLGGGLRLSLCSHPLVGLIPINSILASCI